MAKMRITRDLTPRECHWLYYTVPAGEEVYEFDGVTYGVLGNGIAVSYVEGEYPFFEVPRDAVEVIDE